MPASTSRRPAPIVSGSSVCSGRCCATAGTLQTSSASANTSLRIIGLKRLSTIEKNGYRAVVDERDLHHRLELARLYAQPTGFQFSHDIFIECPRNLRRRRRGKGWTTAVA